MGTSRMVTPAARGRSVPALSVMDCLGLRPSLWCLCRPCQLVPERVSSEPLRRSSHICAMVEAHQRLGESGDWDAIVQHSLAFAASCTTPGAASRFAWICLSPFLGAVGWAGSKRPSLLSKAATTSQTGHKASKCAARLPARPAAAAACMGGHSWTATETALAQSFQRVTRGRVCTGLAQHRAKPSSQVPVSYKIMRSNE